MVGGGISGLAAAFELAQAGRDFVLLEAGDRLGGKIESSFVDGSGLGFEVDCAADGFLARVPDAVDLCREIGLGEDLVAPATGRAFIWAGGKLRPIPSPSVLGVPLDAHALASSGIVSPAGAADFARRIERRFEPLSGDASVGEVLRPRIGNEAFEQLVDPLLGGISAGSADDLSIDAGAAALAQAAQRGGSFGDALVGELRAAAASSVPGRPARHVMSSGDQAAFGHRSANAGPSAVSLSTAVERPPEEPAGEQHRAGASSGGSQDAPVFNGIRGGTYRLVKALADRLGERVRLGQAVTALRASVDEAGGGGTGNSAGWQVVAEDAVIDASGVILATPAWVTAQLIGPHAPNGAGELARLEYSDVALATFVADKAAVEHPLDGSGFLVPRSEGLLMTACSWASSKWAHFDDGAHAVLRVSAGRSDDRRWLDLGPAELTVALADELRLTIGMTGEPAARLSVWRRSLPQYRPGHLERCDRLDTELEANAPGLVVCGAAARGLGLPACIRQGRSAARRLIG